MASPAEFPEGRKSPNNRKVPHGLTTSFFKSKRSGEARSPTSLQSPTISLRGPGGPDGDILLSGSGSPVTGEGQNGRAMTEPISIPAVQPHASYKQHKKLAPSTTFNTHYRSISRSMNDLGNIFSRGRSPPNRDVSPRRVGAAGGGAAGGVGPGSGGSSLNTLPEGKSRWQPESPRTKPVDRGRVPSISVAQHGEQIPRARITREGWLNVIDSHTAKKGALKDVWRLQHAIISEGYLMLYKPPSSCQIKSFDFSAGPPSPQRPQSAPATASPAFNISALRHRSTARHPELVISDDGSLQGGTVEALCHELIFSQDEKFVNGAALTLSGWTGPETALSVLIELSALKDSALRIGEILTIIAESTPGLLLDPGCYNCARLLIEKGVAPHNQALAKALRQLIEDRTTQLKKALDARNAPIESNQSPPETAIHLTTLTTDEFVHIDPDLFATQVHLFHLRYFCAWSPSNDISLLLVSPHLPPPSHRNPLVFNTTSIHFLGERVLDHLLTGDSASSVDRRAKILSKWMKIAQLLKARGDMVGYIAIIMAVLSPPILRLRETWSIVDSNLLKNFKDSARKAMRILERRRLGGDDTPSEGRAFVPKGVGVDIPCAEAVPFLGDLCHCMDEAYASRGRNIDYIKSIKGLEAIKRSLNKWEKEWVNAKAVPGTPRNEWTDVEEIQNCLHTLNANNQNPPSTYSTIFFDKSLGCELSITGMYLHSHYHQKLPLSTGANVPLIFTAPLTSFSLFDRWDTLAISGTLHKKTPSSGLASTGVSSTPYSQVANQSNQNLRPPTSQGQPPLRRTRSFPPSKPSAQTTGYDDLDFTTHERTAGLHSGDNAMLRAIRDVAGVGQQLFYSKDGELVLKTITDDSHSRPSSVIETTSKRQSVASRHSTQLPSTGASPRASSASDVPSSPRDFALEQNRLMLVVPKGGTLERLVDILVLGVEDFSKRMNSSDGNGDSSRTPMLRMNMDVFTVTFFATFRSYCSPVVLIDYLKKRLLGSKSAATFKDESDDVVFPDWTGVDHVHVDRVDWSLVAKIHLGILDAINVWISEFFMDFHCDQYLGESFVSFLEIAGKEMEHWNRVGPEHAHLHKSAEQITHLWDEVREKYSRLAFLPSLYQSSSEVVTASKLLIPPPFDIPFIENFIEALEFKVSDCFRTVKLVDWMFAFELLEAQSAEPLGFFVPKVSLLSHEEEEALQNIFFLLRTLRRGNSAGSLLESLPKCLRDVCTLHMEISNWALMQLVDQRCNVEQRARKIATLLKCLAICRKRMSGMDLYENAETGVRRHVPSFVANAIANALVKPESRMFVVAWQTGARMAAGLAPGAAIQLDTLEQVVPEDVSGVRSVRPMTPCVGWMVERLLEIVCHVPNMVVENNRLINFDKRRYVYNFINNLTNDDTHPLSNDILSANFYSLSSPESFDIRAIRDVASRENQQSKQGRIKVFWKLLHQEQEKLRRDAKQREAIERQQRQQLRAEHRRQQPIVPKVEPVERKSGKRLGVNSIFKAVRPISMALTGSLGSPQNSTRIVAPADLPPLKAPEPGRKPTASIDLRTANSVSCPKGTREQFLWKLSSENGTSYLLQATSENDLDEWLKTIASIRGVAVTDGTESVDALTVLSQARTVQPVFGVTLEELCRRDKVKVPVVMEALLSEIEARGLSEVGIYRVPGSLSSINALKTALDSGEDVRMDDDRWYDINVIAGVVKLFMRELPDRIVPSDSLLEFRNMTANIPDEDDRVPAYRDLMLRLPSQNYNFLRRLYLHFSLIAKNASVNKMHAVNLAIVFGMGIAPDISSPLGISPDLGIYQTMVKTWITHADEIFPEVEDDDHASSSIARGADSGDVASSAPSSPALQLVPSASSQISAEDPLPGTSTGMTFD